MLIVGVVHSYDVQTRGEYTNYTAMIKLSTKEFIQVELTKFQYDYLDGYKDLVELDIRVTGRAYLDKQGVEKCMNTIFVNQLSKGASKQQVPVKAEESRGVIDPKKTDVSDMFSKPDAGLPEDDGLPF